MRHILTLVLIFIVTLGYSQNSGYPINTRNIVVGYQTTPEGIFYRGDTVPTFTPEKRYGTFMYVDTVRGNTYMYYNSVNKWKNIGSDSLLYNSSAQLLALKNGNEIALTVRTDTTLTGYNTLAQPLGVDTNVIATKYDISDLSPDKLYYPEVINKTGVLIKKGTLVMVDTLQLVQGDHVRIIPAVNNGRILSDYVMGVANQDISSDALGRVSWFGYVFEVKHSDIAQTGITLVAGDILYSSTTESGKFTNVPPTAPAHQSKIALLVRKPNDNNITLLVRPWLASKLDNLSNVKTSGAINLSVLRYNNVTNTWDASTTPGIVASDTSAMLSSYVKGTGVSGQVAYWSGTGTQTGSSFFTYDNTNKRLYIDYQGYRDTYYSRDGVFHNRDFSIQSGFTDPTNITLRAGGGFTYGAGSIILSTMVDTREIARFTFDINGEHRRLGIGTTTPSYTLDLNTTNAIRIPVGTTIQRPVGVAGVIRYNSDNTNVEFHNGTTWSGLQNTIALTTSGTNGAATFNGTALNVPSYKGNFMTIGNIGSSNYLSSSLSALQLGTGSGGSIQNGDLYMNVNSNEQFGAKYTFMVNGTPSIAAINSYFTFKNQYSFLYTNNDQSFSIIKYGFGSHLGSGTGYSNLWYSDVYHTTPPYDYYNVHTNENVSAIRIDGENYTKALYINNQTTTNHSLYVDGGLTRLTKTGILQNSPLYSLDINATDAIRIPVGTTTQRPAALNNGIVRYNTDSLNLEYYSNSNWRDVINGTGYYDDGYRKSYLALFTGTANGKSNSVTYDNISSTKSAFNNSGLLDVNYTDTAGVRIYPNNWASGKRAYLTIGETTIQHVWGSQPNLSSAAGFRFNLTNPTGNDQRFNIYSNDTSRFNLKLSNGYIGLLGINNPTSPIHIQVKDADEIYDYIRFQNTGTSQAYLIFEQGSIANSTSRIGKTAVGSTGIMSASGNYQGIFYYPVTNMASINVNVPTRTLDVNGEVRVRDLTTTTPTKIVGSDVDGVLSGITVGSGLTLSSGTLSASGVTSTTGFSDGTSNAITITLEAASKPNHVFRYNHSGTISVSSVTINNAVIGGVYTIHFQDCIGAANQVTVTWPTTFKDLSGSGYGTRYYNSPTLVTCYYDGTNFNCN